MFEKTKINEKEAEDRPFFFKKKLIFALPHNEVNRFDLIISLNVHDFEKHFSLSPFCREKMDSEKHEKVGKM